MPGAVAEDAVPTGCRLSCKTPLSGSQATARSQPLIGFLQAPALLVCEQRGGLSRRVIKQFFEV